MRLVLKKITKTDKYRAYFDNAPNFYGEGDTKEAAIKELTDKVYAVLRAIENIHKTL